MNTNKAAISTILFEDRAGEQYKLEIFLSCNAIIDRMLDQFNMIKKVKFITSAKFHLDNPGKIELLDDDNKTLVGILWCEQRHIDGSYLLNT